MFRNIQDYHHMQYRVDSSQLRREKGQCAYMHNLCTLCINRMYAWTITSTKCSETFRTTIICNIESIWATEVEKKANVHMCTFYACTIYAHYACPFNCAWPVTTARCWEIFRTIIICDIESIQATKVKKMTKNIYFCSFLHNLCTLCTPN